jgi:hypothetical protein
MLANRLDVDAATDPWWEAIVVGGFLQAEPAVVG